MTYRNYYYLFLTSILVSLGLLLMQITGGLFELYDIVYNLEYILYGIGIFIFTTYFMTDSRVNQLISIVPLKNYLFTALAIGFLNYYTFQNIMVQLSVDTFITLIFGIISVKYLDKRVQMDFVGLGITYIFFKTLISVSLSIFSLLGYTLSGIASISFGGIGTLWLIYVGASILLYVTYLILVTTKGNQMPEVMGTY